MKITIDTKEDSHDDIKRVIKMLQNLVGDSYSNADLSSLNSAPQVSAQQSETMFNMFDSVAAATPQSPTTIPPLNSKIDDEEEDLKDLPQLVPY
jgi:hypothetical protein